MQEPQSRQIELGGKPYHYLNFGGEGPPLIFSHGTGLHAWTWQTHARALAGKFHCYAVDHRGHGDSGKSPTDGYGWQHMADDLAAFARRLGLAPAYCIGHSMGAATAALAEARSPGLWRAAILLDPIIMPQPYYSLPIGIETQPMAAKTVKRREFWESTDQMMESYSKKMPFMSWRPEELRNYVEKGTEPASEGRVKLKCPPAIEARCYLGGHEIDPWPLLPSVKAPMLLMQGTAADTRALVRLDQIAAALPDAEIRDVEGATHFLPMDNPESVVEAALDFFARH